MKTTLSPIYDAPAFDAQISNWIDSFHSHPWPSISHRVGIAHFTSGEYVVYRTIEASCVLELKSLLIFLRLIGMIDVNVKQKDRDLIRIFGYPKFSTISSGNVRTTGSALGGTTIHLMTR